MGLNLGLDYTKLYETSRMIQEMTGVKLHPHKAVVGRNSFGFESGAGLEGSAKGNSFISETYLPEGVGQKFNFLPGKKSGKYSIQMKLKELSLEVPEEKVDGILQRVKKRPEETKQMVSDEEFREMARKAGA